MTDKDTAIDTAEQIYMSFGDNETDEAIEILNNYAESYHAKKCAGIADRIKKAWREYGEDITLRTLRSAIIGDSATDHIVDANKKDDHIPNAGKKLDVVVKALEEIRSDACVLFGIHHPALDAGFGPAKDIIQTVDRTMKEIKK